MYITNIIRKKCGCSDIYVNGEYFSNIDNEIIFKENIKVGDYIDNDRLLDILKSSNIRKAKEKALRLISRKDYSKKELLDKLTVSTNLDAAEIAVNKMEEVGIINDKEFAKKYAKDLILRKRFAQSRVEYELYKKGIDKDLIEETLNEFYMDPKEQINYLLEKKYFSLLDSEKGKVKLISSLKRLGYKWGEIYASLNEYISDKIYEDD